MDATLVTARSDKEGAAPAWKKGCGHPLGCWVANTRECPEMKLRPGNAGSNTFTDHKEVLDGALKQVPVPFRRKVIVRIDGAGASHDLVRHLLTLSSPRKTLLFTCGWMITEADEAAIMAVPGDAWKPGACQSASFTLTPASSPTTPGHASPAVASSAACCTASRYPPRSNSTPKMSINVISPTMIADSTDAFDEHFPGMNPAPMRWRR
jgi:hypothetical protein